jgi:hypothetical protein
MANNNRYKTKNLDTRHLIINNFRNIGITYHENDPSTELVLNRSLEKGTMGDLVILVGPNNSGKSNVLAALESFGKNNFQKDDSPDFMYSTQNPSISMVVQNGDKEGIRQLGGTKENQNEKTGESYKQLSLLDSQLNKLTENLDELRKKNFGVDEDIGAIEVNRSINKKKYPTERESEIISDYISRGNIKSDTLSSFEAYLKNTDRYYSSDVSDIVKKRIVELKEQGKNDGQLKELMKHRIDLSNSIQKIKAEIEEIKSQISYHEKIIETENNSAASAKSMDTSQIPEYQYLLSPKIIVYKQKSVQQTDLSCKPDKPTDFIKNIFRIMEKNSNVLVNIYQKYEGKNQKGYLKKFTEELNKELPEKITKCFNDMYFCGEGEEYSFEFDLESELVSVILYRGGVPLDLDKQSTGFRWFFDFFFNFAYKEELKVGDIIIMDEPATNMHVSGQTELRKFLKELARKNGLTFVISTHSPFLIDCDCLDELRLMQRDEQGYVAIASQFTMVRDNADKLDPILNGLTVGRHILVGSQKVVFVEGITDYNYLTAFKLFFSQEDEKYKNLVFLPVGGVKNENLVTALCDTDKSPTLLVDGDKAGIDFKKKANGTNLTVISLIDVPDSNFKELESLFSKEDGEKFSIKEKEWNKSSTFKKCIFENISQNEISEETINQFRKILDWLLDV